MYFYRLHVKLSILNTIEIVYCTEIKLTGFFFFIFLSIKKKNYFNIFKHIFTKLLQLIVNKSVVYRNMKIAP